MVNLTDIVKGAVLTVGTVAVLAAAGWGIHRQWSMEYPCDQTPRGTGAVRTESLPHEGARGRSYRHLDTYTCTDGKVTGRCSGTIDEEGTMSPEVCLDPTVYAVR